MRHTLALLAIALAAPAIAAPGLLHAQGRLLDSTGGALSGVRQVTFRLYPSDVGGSAFWAEPQTLTLTDGYYTALIGNGLDLADLDQAEVWLGVEVGTGGELGGRQRLASVPYALRASIADHAVTADAATTAGHATTADTATSATTATTAGHATTADTATTATTATHASGLSCPSDMANAGAFCIDKAENSAQSWQSHASLCVGEGKRMCSMAEWMGACTRAGTLGLSAMTDDFEYVDEYWVMNYTNGGYYSSYVSVGDGNCGRVYYSGWACSNSSCYDTTAAGDSYPSRCCR